MRFNVTFRCSLAIDLDKHPAGEELAEFLAAQFRERGLPIHVDDSLDYAWSLAFKEKTAPTLVVGFVGDGDYEWLVVINSGVNWLGRLFDRSDAKLREDLALRLHTILTNAPEFSVIRWHVSAFSDEGWTASPEGPSHNA